MPADDRLGRDEAQVLTPAGAEPTSQDPQELVPGTKGSPRPGSSRSGQDGELMAQQQVLDHEVLARARPG